MGKLKPIGSEKLQGYEKISRIMEIARYKESLPNSINETTSNNYNITLYDGNTYHIDKEKNGYVIKKTLSEGRTEYIEPMKNRKFYSSYSQALKRLNLIIKEVNALYGQDSNVSLFSEDKKFVLKTPKPQTDAPDLDDNPVSTPTAPPPSTAPNIPPPDTGSDESEPMGDEDMGGEDEPMGDEDMGGEDEPMGDEDMGGEDVGGDEESSDSDSGVVSFKTIQKLTGKLGQKLRKMSQGEDGLSADDTKYVINSILSALDLSVLEDEDVEEIIGRLEDSEFESDDDISDEEPTDDGEEPTDSEDEVTGDEESTPPTDDELPESYDYELGEEETNEYIEGMIGGDYDLGFSDEPKYPQKKSYFTKLKDRMGDMMEDDEYEGVSKIFDSVFSESKVDNIIKSYFVETEKEKQFIQEKKKEKFLIEKARKTKTMNEVRNLSESYRQEQISSKFLDRYTKAQFVGKTNKKNLVFEVNGKQYKITPDGAIL